MPALRTCAACGFENALTEADCPLCGASSSDQPTLLADDTTLCSGERARHAPGSLEGQLLGQRFQVEALLGRGGMGEVYQARDLRSSSPESNRVAIKVIHSLEDEAQEGRFQREIVALSRIHHPAVPAILDHGVDAGRPWYACELVRGRDLRFVVREDGPLASSATAALGAAVAEALAAAHAVGVIHRDVKPANIMVADDGSVKLLDFGLARGEGLDLAALTRTGMIVGTPSYMSPEQFEGRTVDARSDLYSLGIVLFEALTGRLPFQAPTPLAMALKHRNEPPPLPRVLCPEAPAWLERLILGCLQKSPAQRPATAADLAAELSRPHTGPRRRKLEAGDWVIEDEPGQEACSLVLATSSERPAWTPGMALRFEERYHKLIAVQPPSVAGGRFVYRFEAWPEVEVFRRVLDYDEDATARGPRSAPKGP